MDGFIYINIPDGPDQLYIISRKACTKIKTWYERLRQMESTKQVYV